MTSSRGAAGAREMMDHRKELRQAQRKQKSQQTLLELMDSI